MNISEKYNLWLEKATEDPDLITELKSIAGDDDAVYDRFYRELEFGTGGLRGVIGAGEYRMNIYTVRRATEGLADYVKEAFPNSPSVAVSFDSRIKSDLFAKEAARVLAANDIKVHIYKELMPTPMLSFAVRELHCSAGIMVTASHNPAKYNGYKVYGADGCQMTLDACKTVMNNIDDTDIFTGVKLTDLSAALSNGMISYIPDSVFNKYLDCVQAQSIHPNICASSGVKVVYTPLNGTGNKPVRAILKRIGVEDITVVPEQEFPDGNFPTCPYPNPEIKEALALGLDLCKTVNPDLLIATDPDADRTGIAVPGPAGYVLFTGNEVGAMLLEYICSERTKLGTMPDEPITIKTIVTTDLVRAIAKAYNVRVIEVLTGFKFIGEQIGFLEDENKENDYIFGFEESYGYLAGTYVRDKDSVVTSMLICEMAAYYKSKGITMLEAREEMYKKYGVYNHSQNSFTCEGAAGMQRMEEIMSDLRANPPKTIGGLTVTKIDDYIAGTSQITQTGVKTKLTLPKSDVLAFYLTDNASVIIRPSGTEPKIKAYYTTTGTTKAEAAALEAKLAKEFSARIGF
ncbi:MAG: phospho-sugar mutase [Ruminococcus sp.]|jgi:phosphoglucomutase|nr:phospho-sugar mutase [Ruminococcus sp.]